MVARTKLQKNSELQRDLRTSRPSPSDSPFGQNDRTGCLYLIFVSHIFLKFHFWKTVKIIDLKIVVFRVLGRSAGLEKCYQTILREILCGGSPFRGIENVVSMVNHSCRPEICFQIRFDISHNLSRPVLQLIRKYSKILLNIWLVHNFITALLIHLNVNWADLYNSR